LPKGNNDPSFYKREEKKKYSFRRWTSHNGDRLEVDSRKNVISPTMEDLHIFGKERWGGCGIEEMKGMNGGGEWEGNEKE
jgi:hypothetical protein